MNNTLAEIVKEIIIKGKERGYMTFEELDKLLPASEFTSEQIDETLAILCDIGINLVDDKAGKEED